MPKKEQNRQFAVLGVGRFGLSIIKTLANYDVDILACDRSPARLHEVTDCATQVVQLNAADEEAISHLGLGNYDVVVIAMGEDFEATLLAAMVAKEQGARMVVAKASGMRQKKILERIGVDQVVLPEHEMGAKLARALINPNVQDILERSGKSIVEMAPLPQWVGKTIIHADIRNQDNILILAVIRAGKTILPVPPDLEIQQDDILITLGGPE
ncbi:MAG: TrkA family potassium uptake protein [Ruminococcaceae bacterium]|nr:TrkA family potassium uptake protein [Oscillospiraceae bacterium]